MSREIYNVKFIVDNNKNNYEEFTGFKNIATIGYFEAGWEIELLYHDIFEHWFEFSDYFSTKTLSQAGECVAMGIREYLYNYSNIPQTFSAYNEYKGLTWNSWVTIISQVAETIDEYAEHGIAKYPNDFNYKTIKGYNKSINLYQGYVNKFNIYDWNIDKKLKTNIEKAFSYGYWLGELVFEDKISMIYDFCTNLKCFLEVLEIDNSEYIKICKYNIDKFKLEVSIRNNNIVANFIDPYNRFNICISSNMNITTIERKKTEFLNKLYERY